MISTPTSGCTMSVERQDIRNQSINQSILVYFKIKMT